MVTALWAVLLSFHVVLMQFLLLYYYKYSLMHVHLSHTIYYITEALRNSKSSLLSTGGISYWERSALWLCVTPGEIHGIFLSSCKSLHGWSITVVNLDGQRLGQWHESTSHFQICEANGQGSRVEGGGCFTKGIVQSGVAWMGGMTGHSSLGLSRLSTWSSSLEEEVGDAVQGSGGTAGVWGTAIAG